MVRWLNWLVLVVLVLACGCTSTKAPATPMKPEVSQEELRSCFGELGLDEGAIARILATAPLQGEILPANAEWGQKRETKPLMAAWTKALEMLADAQPEKKDVLQVAAALLMQEKLLYDIYHVSYPLVKDEEEIDVERYRGQILVILGQRLRRFRQEHPEIPGVLAEQLLAELEAWMTFSAEWDVAYSLNTQTLTTDAAEVGEISSEEQVNQCFVRCAEAPVPPVEDGKQLWYHWCIGGDMDSRVTALAIYLPVLPAGSQCVMNGVPQALAENACSLLSVEWQPGERMEVDLAIRLPEGTLNDSDGRAKFPVVLLQKMQKETVEK